MERKSEIMTPRSSGCVDVNDNGAQAAAGLGAGMCREREGKRKKGKKKKAKVSWREIRRGRWEGK